MSRKVDYRQKVLTLNQRWTNMRPWEEGVLAACGACDVEAGGEGEDGGLDCVICMTPVEFEVINARMVTPCNHFFHTECLTRWMDVKMECPTCRGALPPL